MRRVTRGTPAGDAYLDLQNQARRDRRPTQELLQLYVLEGFLARLAHSDLRSTLVLKGGVLLAAFDARRPTKDIDLAAMDVANDIATVTGVVRQVLALPPTPDDGIEFVPDTITGGTIREDGDYSGVRVNVEANLASARLPFHVDVNVGDPIWPAPQTVLVPRLRGGDPLELRAIPSTWSWPRRSSRRSNGALRTRDGGTSATSGVCPGSRMWTPTIWQER